MAGETTHRRRTSPPRREAVRPRFPFWDFSLTVYARPGVAPACLALQDDHGLDVNILLLCCWLGRRTRPPLSQADIGRLRALSDPWQTRLVGRVRALRRRLKAAAAAPPATLDAVSARALLAEVQALELDAEHAEQRLLLTALPRRQRRVPAPAAEIAAANLCAYLDHCAVDRDAAVRRGLGTVLAGAFPALDAQALAALDL